MKKQLLSFLFLIFGANAAFAAAGIWRAALLINWNGNFQWYYLGSNSTGNGHQLLQGANFGNMIPANIYFMIDPYFFSFENSGCNITGGRFYHRVYKTGDTPGAYQVITFSMTKICSDPDWRTTHNPCSSSNGDEEWGNDQVPVDLKAAAEAANGTVGQYKFEAYWEADVGNCGAQTLITTDVQVATFTLDAPLSADFAKFQAQKIAREVALNWTTHAERDLQQFDVMRSADLMQWETIHSLAAKNEGNVPQQYATTDAQPLAGMNYYRLRVHDRDGRSFHYSNIVQVRMGREGQILLSPNPSTDGFAQLVLPDGLSAESLWLRLYDTQGRLLKAWLAESNGSDDAFPIDVSFVPSGTYFIQVQGFNTALPLLRQ